MPQSDMINRIIHAEKEASDIVKQAKDRQVRLHEDISGETERMRALFMLKANERIGLIEAQESAAADERIAQLGEKSLQEIGHINKLYDDNREIWVSRLFDMIVGAKNA